MKKSSQYQVEKRRELTSAFISKLSAELKEVMNPEFDEVDLNKVSSILIDTACGLLYEGIGEVGFLAAHKIVSDLFDRECLSKVKE